MASFQWLTIWHILIVKYFASNQVLLLKVIQQLQDCLKKLRKNRIVLLVAKRQVMQRLFTNEITCANFLNNWVIMKINSSCYVPAKKMFSSSHLYLKYNVNINLEIRSWIHDCLSMMVEKTNLILWLRGCLSLISGRQTTDLLRLVELYYSSPHVHGFKVPIYQSNKLTSKLD